ncbi:MAG: GSU2403 family nucleotidyltransferase fold protein [Candidatus Omnitrophota bacterium]
MEKKQYDLCLDVLQRFHKQKILSELILIGSWCVVFYEKYFSGQDDLRKITLITRDIDFLIDHPASIKVKVDIPELLKDLGFITTFKGAQGYIKLDHPELILEFLTPERGRGREKPYPLPSLGVNATALRFLEMLTQNIIQVKIDQMTIKLPHPANFALHKLIIAPRRLKKEKTIKDQETAMIVLKALINHQQISSIKKAYKTIPFNWQKKIIDALRQTEDIGLLNELEKT